MRKLLLTFLIGLPISLFSQDYNTLESAFAHGDAKAIALLFDDEIDCMIEGMESVHSKEASEANLRSFFMAHPPVGFKRVHNGVSANKVHYMIGELSSADQVFRVTTYLLMPEEAMIIQSIEIEAN